MKKKKKKKYPYTNVWGDTIRSPKEKFIYELGNFVVSGSGVGHFAFSKLWKRYHKKKKKR